MNPIISRDPVQVAEISNKKIKQYKDKFREVLNRANDRRVLLLVLFGGYQQGKSSTAALFTGNDRHVIGNGVDEQTRGVWMDGPVSFHELAQRFLFPMDNVDFQDDPAIFVLDCEGAGGFKPGDNEEQCRMLIQQLEIPFISLSTVMLFIAHKNESIDSIENVSSLLKLEACSLDINEAVQKSMTLIPLFKNMGKYKNVDYRHPDANNYKLLSQQLEIVWLPRFIDKKYQFVPRPLPRFDEDEDIFHQNNDFYAGFNLVVHDILNIFIGSLNGFSIHKTNEIYDLYSSIVDSPMNKAFEITIQNLKLNASLKSIQNIAKGNITDVMQKIDDDISNFNTQQRNQNTKLDLQEIENFRKTCNKKSDDLMKMNLPNKYFEVPIVHDLLITMHQNINQKIDNLSKNLITDLSPTIIRKIMRQLNELGDEKIQEIFEMISTIDGFNQFSNQKQQLLSDIEQEIKSRGQNLLDENAKNIEDIKYEIGSDINNCINRIKSAIFAELSNQEIRLSKKEAEFKKETDPNNPNMIVHYLRYVTTLPNGIRKEEPWNIVSREPKIYQTQITVEKRRINHDQYYSNQERKKIQTGPNSNDIFYTEWREVSRTNKPCLIC